MDALQFLNLARNLTAKDDAARCRTGISRAYYAAYHVALVLCRNGMGLNILGAHEAHSNAEHCLRLSEDHAVREVASRLGDLYQKRIQADYRLGRTDVERASTARLYVDIAERIVRDLEACAKDPKRLSSMKAAILRSPALKGKVADLGKN